MTWSIVARDELTGALGVAVATRSLAVGGIAPHGAGRVGALATQARFNPLYATDGLQFLAEGRDAEEVVGILTSLDPGRATRQVHMIDSRGGIGNYTGDLCEAWCGHIKGPNVSVAGNMLAGRTVVMATLDTFLEASGQSLAERLLRSLEAGEAEGGDKRGKQSAAIKVWHAEPYAVLDLRTDDHAEPLVELRRLYELALRRYVGVMQTASSRTNPGGVFDTAERDRFLSEGLKDHVS
jgi:uncharacterized Ntn-hydrolase superfamily protein